MTEQHRFNAYQIMWIFVFYDLPTDTAEQRKHHASFRKNLLKDGFWMSQLSVYTRPCMSREIGDVHIARVEKMLPAKGKVSILMVTDKQYGSMKLFWGKTPKPQDKPDLPPQLELF